ATAPGSWRAALLQAHRTEWELLAHQDFPVGDLAVELGLTGPAFETVFDVLGGEGTLAPGTVLWVSIWPQRGLLTLRLRYRTDVLDADAAARIAGYHLTALALIAADPEAEHERQPLLSPAELDFQLDGLAGPRRERPSRRMHELFEQRVRMHPEAIAATCGGRQWTYTELNARANPASRSGPISSPTSTSPAAPPAIPRARCASTRACSTTCTPRSRTWRSARDRWSRRPRPSASTSPCGSWFPRCSSAGER